HQVPHRVSVDSDSIGTKNPFSGQASSHSITPSLGEAERRTSRYSPLSSLWISNCWPGWMLSCSKSSAGITIWPFEDMAVFIRVRYGLTLKPSMTREDFLRAAVQARH